MGTNKKNPPPAATGKRVQTLSNAPKIISQNVRRCIAHHRGFGSGLNPLFRANDLIIELMRHANRRPGEAERQALVRRALALRDDIEDSQ